jgi:hypothetical protein
MWLCALAYWQLLLMRDEVEKDVRPAWHPSKAEACLHKMTSGQVQWGASRIMMRLGTPAHATRTAGKEKGRAIGYRPAPRKRFPVVKKAKFNSGRALASP